MPKCKTLDEKRHESLVAEWENLCDPLNGCGVACCHYEGSPCEKLQWTDKPKRVGVCSIYPTRFGQHKTVDGKVFQCVPMRVSLMHNPAPEKCGYGQIKSIEGVPVVKGML